MTFNENAILQKAKGVLGDALGDPAIPKRVKAHAKAYNKTLVELAWSLPKKSRKVHQAEIHAALNDPSSKVCVLIEVAKKLGKKISLDEIETIANTISPYRDCGEPYGGKLVTKSDGSLRPTLVLRFKRAALALLLVRVLRIILPEDPNQFCRLGAGRTRAVKTVLKFINEEERHWLLKFDIKNFHPSIRRTNIPALLGISQSIVNNVLFIPEGASLPSNLLDTISEQAVRQALPMGSPTSPLVANEALRQALEPFSPNLAVVAYSDNVMVACGSKQEAEAIYKDLALALQQSPPGRLELHEKKIHHVSRSTYFLGYDIKWDPTIGRARASPTPGNTDAFIRRLRVALRATSKFNLDRVALDQAKSFRAGFGAWEQREEATVESFSDVELCALDEADAEGRRRADASDDGPCLDFPNGGDVEVIYHITW
jgi:hypothetical protein